MEALLQMEVPTEMLITNKMLSIEKCHEVLNKGKKKYSREEAIVIRNYLYGFANILDQVKPAKNE